MEFFIVDAFSSKPFGGNAAGVVIYKDLGEEAMQKLAAELRFSETVFIKQLSSSHFSMRYFTPNSEVALCGHATIAGFKVLMHKGVAEDNKTYIIETLNESLNVSVKKDYIFMEAGKAVKGDFLDSSSVEELANILDISPLDIGDVNFNLAPQIISTGLYDIMLPVKTKEVLNKINADYNALSMLSERLQVVGVHAFTLDSAHYTAECRNFAPLYDINEEAATGTSNASLTYYLYINKVITDFDKSFLFKQGESMNRPSEIITKLSTTNGLRIQIGGQAAILSEGKLFI